MKLPPLRVYLPLCIIACLPLSGLANQAASETLQDSSYYLVSSPLWTAAKEDLENDAYESAGDHLLAAGNQIVRRLQKRYQSLDINNSDQVVRVREMLDQASYAYEQAEDAYSLTGDDEAVSSNKNVRKLCKRHKRLSKKELEKFERRKERTFNKLIQAYLALESEGIKEDLNDQANINAFCKKHKKQKKGEKKGKKAKLQEDDDDDDDILDAIGDAITYLEGAKAALLSPAFNLKGWHADLQGILDSIDNAGITDDCADHVLKLVTQQENPESIKDTSTINIVPL